MPASEILYSDPEHPLDQADLSKEVALRRKKRVLLHLGCEIWRNVLAV